MKVTELKRKAIGLARHEDGGCRVCRHAQREAIESAFVAWKTLREIEAEQFAQVLADFRRIDVDGADELQRLLLQHEASGVEADGT